MTLIGARCKCGNTLSRGVLISESNLHKHFVSKCEMPSTLVWNTLEQFCSDMRPRLQRASALGLDEKLAEGKTVLFRLRHGPHKTFSLLIGAEFGQNRFVCCVLVLQAGWVHLFPFRTEQLSALASMILGANSPWESRPAPTQSIQIKRKTAARQFFFLPRHSAVS